MSEYYTPHHPIRKVAIIGAGPSGTPAARHLVEAGLEVRVFERQAQAGGIWNFRPEVSYPLSVPTPPPSRGAFTPVLKNDGSYTVGEEKEEVKKRFNPPNPCYWSLSNNVPTQTMAFKDFPWPEGTQSNISHTAISDYVHSYAQHFGLDKITSFNTRVERAVKIEERWVLTLRKVEDVQGELKETYWTEIFDAVVVATGHYNAPYIPYIEGADAWAAKWSDRIIHSQGYRTSEPYVGQNILIIGTGTSGVDIAHDLSPHVNKIYMVGKNKLRGPEGYKAMRRMQRYILPGNAEQVPEITRFKAPLEGTAGIEGGEVEFSDGRVVRGISRVIFATGYQYSYPFLPSLHRDSSTPPSHPSPVPLVTSGDGVLHLYRDVFYLPDPTLSFLGISVNTSAFSFFEYQSLSISRVYTSTARLPNEARRWDAYARVIAEKGEGKFSHFLGKEGERAYVRETIEWLNRDAEWGGVGRLEGHSEEWLRESDKILGTIAGKYGITDEVWKLIKEGGDDLVGVGGVGVKSVGIEKIAADGGLGEVTGRKGNGGLAKEETDRKEQIAVARKSSVLITA